jgi:hypothetical protein
MVAQLTALKQLMTTVQLRTRAVIGAKKENMNLQAEVAAICRGAVSPACSTLASIDFDIFYKEGGTQILSDLETLNYTLAQRECEIQKAALKLQILTDTFGCPAVAGSEILGNSRTAAGYYPNTCDPLTNDPVFKYFTGDNDTRFTVKKDLGYVPAEELKVAFEEISSYFDSPGYAPLFAKILDQLSILLRVPSLNDYATGSQNITTINDTITNIGKSLVRIFSA